MAECGLGALDEGLLDIGDSECGLVRRNDLVVDHGGQGKRDVVLGHADLARHFDDLNLDIDCLKILTQRVNLDKTGVHGAFEAAICQYPVRCIYRERENIENTYRPNLETRPTSPWEMGLKGFGQQKQQGIAPMPPINEPRP